MRVPLVFYAIMWGTSLHLDIVTEKPRLKDAERIFHKTEIIRILSADFRKQSLSLGDDQLMAMFVLATHDSYNVQETVPDVFQAPLTNLGWLNVYWRMKVSDLHLQALFTAVDIRGGLDAIELVGLAEIIS